MNIANVIALGAFLLSAVSAVVAIVQAAQARTARGDAQVALRDARLARDAAAAHEKAALEASQEAAAAATRSAVEATRTADALEEANDLARAQLSTDVLELERGEGNHFAVRNVSRNTLFAFGLVEVPANGDITILGDLPYELHPNQVVAFAASRSFASPTVITVVCSWGDPTTGERTSQQLSLF